MKYFIFRLHWSQTDASVSIVKASTLLDAQVTLKNSGYNARYVDFLGSTGTMIEGE